MVGAGLVPARIARRAMTVIALTRDSGSHKGCPYIFARLCNSPGLNENELLRRLDSFIIAAVSRSHLDTADI